MKITQLETILTNAGLRNYHFVRLSTDAGLTGVGAASLEWQEKAVEALLHEPLVKSPSCAPPAECPPRSATNCQE